MPDQKQARKDNWQHSSKRAWIIQSRTSIFSKHHTQKGTFLGTCFIFNSFPYFCNLLFIPSVYVYCYLISDSTMDHPSLSLLFLLSIFVLFHFTYSYPNVYINHVSSRVQCSSVSSHPSANFAHHCVYNFVMDSPSESYRFFLHRFHTDPSKLCQLQMIN